MVSQHVLSRVQVIDRLSFFVQAYESTSSNSALSFSLGLLQS